jgi:hypothetical protein
VRIVIKSDTTTMSSTQPPNTTYHLYTYYASSCAARLRIAFNLKGIDYVPHYIDSPHKPPNFSTPLTYFQWAKTTTNPRPTARSIPAHPSPL